MCRKSGDGDHSLVTTLTQLIFFHVICTLSFYTPETDPMTYDPVISRKLLFTGELPVPPVVVRGYDFNKGIDFHELLSSYKYSGFQATNFGLAVDQINQMVFALNFFLLV